MNIYTCNSFEGFYPVGTAAVIVAESNVKAKAILDAELKRMGLSQDVPIGEINRLETGMPDAIILCNGDY